MPALAALALALAACGERKDDPKPAAAKDLRPDGTLVEVDDSQRRRPSGVPVPPPTGTAPVAPMPAAEAAVRAAGAPLYAPVSEYTKEISEMVDSFPAYVPVKDLPGGTFRMRGSESMGAYLSNAQARFESIYPKVSMSMRTGGSERGLAALLAGECDVAAVAGPVTDAQRAAIEKATGKRLFAVPVALDAVCLFVNADNPLSSLSRQQCNGIFSITHSMSPTPILRWDQVDPKSPLGDAFVPIYLTGSSTGTLASFMQWCMPGEEVSTILRYFEPSSGSVVNACCAYPTALGVAGYGARQARARAVAIDPGDGRPPVAPSAATIRDRSYPLHRAMHLVFVAKDSASIDPAIVQFVRYLWSEDGQDVSAISNLVPPTLDLMPVEVTGTPSGDFWK
jgi:phosphate transport system substrate-binding protein